MSLLDSLRNSLGRSLGRRTRAGGAAAHMTWASRSVSQSISHTRLFLKRQLWVWPIIAIVLLTTIGFGVHRAIESTMKTNLHSSLQTLLGVEREMLERWLMTQERNAETLANDAETRRLVEQLLRDVESDEGETSVVSLQKELSAALAPSITSHHYVGYFLIDRTKTILAATDAELVGRQNVPSFDDFVSKALDGATIVSSPFASVAAVKDEAGNSRSGVPTMFVCAPVRDQNLQIVAVLALRIRPELEFTEILQLGRINDSGETYAFDRTGLLLSNSRFDEQLKILGILDDKPGTRSILNVLIRDPGANLTEGRRRNVHRYDMPLTAVVAAAPEAVDKIEVGLNGHNDYRGVPSVAAWTWLSKYNFGLATEVDVSEAFGPLTILKRTFWGLLGLLMLSSLAIFLFTIRVARLQRQAREAAIEAKQLGQYKLEEKLGAGAMGVVYKGRHAMMRRPTAIKMLDADSVTPQSIARFEREVQITSQLTHPNTVAIYDFGRTPEDVFYFAMEYLEGIDLQNLVEQYGPQPAGRVIHILRQACGSLYEAHSTGLVHRDVKPANLMLTRRGGEADVVKVLDFGLVKARDDEPTAGEDRSLAGTPLYMSPEAIQMPSSVDGCSDIYAVGAVGYFLLTGKPVFEATSIVDLCNKHVSETPVPPSQRLGKPVPEDLEIVILACLEKSRAKRPQTARELAQRLARCAAAGDWTLEDAEAWWSRHDRGIAPSKAPLPGDATLSRQYEATIDR